MSPLMSTRLPGPPLGTPLSRLLTKTPFSWKVSMSQRTHSAAPERNLSMTSEFTMGVSVKIPLSSGAMLRRSR
ncbi:hypothetical protein RRF57_009189 [Xylaria bambusicola]|uniref:Uncharacterized protein n=1 Tax=Xylaria bambusicola TaxID=326684 RepID=A0AAN7UJ58_9PEZI